MHYNNLKRARRESFFSLISSLYIGLFLMYAHVCIRQKTLVGVDSLLLPHGSWELISGLQTIHQICFQMNRDSTSPLVLERTSSMLIRKNWQKFKIEDTLITCIWSLHNVYVNCNATLFLIRVYKYVTCQFKKEKKNMKLGWGRRGQWIWYAQGPVLYFQHYTQRPNNPHQFLKMYLHLCLRRHTVTISVCVYVCVNLSLYMILGGGQRLIINAFFYYIPILFLTKLELTNFCLDWIANRPLDPLGCDPTALSSLDACCYSGQIPVC